MRKQLKNTLLPLLLLLILQQGNAQRIDTIIDKPAYQSYFSFAVKSPLYVVYYLYKGGGDCSRERFQFTKEYRSANNKDYLKSLKESFLLSFFLNHSFFTLKGKKKALFLQIRFAPT